MKNKRIKEFVAVLLAPLMIALVLLHIVLALIVAAISVVDAVAKGTFDGFTEYFSDVLELPNDRRRTR